jgi:hypothetical protein
MNIRTMDLFMCIMTTVMKILLFLLAILLCTLSYAQSPSRILRYASASTVFGENLPAGVILVAVSTADDKLQTKSVAYLEVIPVLVEAMKEQQAVINRQLEIQADQQNQIDELKKRIQSLIKE